MSRIGRKPITIPKDVNVNISGSKVSVEGSKGKLERTVPDCISLELKDGVLTLRSASDSKIDKSLLGTNRVLIVNMVKGVSEGYSKQLEIVGVGFRAQIKEKKLSLQLGFSHPVVYEPLEGVSIETPKPIQILVKGIDKEKVGQVAAEIRSIMKPEPYKGKGIRYSQEHVRKKLGKAISKQAA